MSILESIVAHRRQELRETMQAVPKKELQRRLASAPPVRDFAAALSDSGSIRLIAEVKRASPSAGTLSDDFDPAAIARCYAAHGAAAVSVLTERAHFQGDLAHLTIVRHSVDIPVLRKDFLLDIYQVIEARAAGADAVLLIAEVLGDAALRELLDATRELGMEALVEFYEPANLPRVLQAGARIVGINNRDLSRFRTNLEHTLRLRDQVPRDRIVVSESGIQTRADVERLQHAGVHAILVGEALMRSRDAGAKIDELLGTAGTK